MIARLETMGFTQTHVNPKTDVVRLKQGDISFLVHRTPAAHAADFARDHGPSANGMAFRTTDAKTAYEGAVERGAKPAQGVNGGALGDDYPIFWKASAARCSMSSTSMATPDPCTTPGTRSRAGKRPNARTTSGWRCWIT